MKTAILSCILVLSINMLRSLDPGVQTAVRTGQIDTPTELEKNGYRNDLARLGLI